jgi:chromosome segregation ATPase
VDATGGPDGPFESPDISAARERLREEIDRVRAGVEEMLSHQDSETGADLRRELERLRIEGRQYAKRRVGKSERRLERSIDGLETRLRDLEQRFHAFHFERQQAEWRIHANTEVRLDGILREVRGIADLLRRTPGIPS